MVKQLVFAFLLLLTLGVFLWTSVRLIRFFRLTQSYKLRGTILERFKMTMAVAMGQNKILRRPVTGFMHAVVFWGFCVILVGSLEMVIDGLTGSERILGFTGGFYDVLMASGDLFAFIIFLLILAFLFRRIFLKIKRFTGEEMKHRSHTDANLSLTLILLLMLTLLGMNTFYLGWAASANHEMVGVYPVSAVLSGLLGQMDDAWLHLGHQVNWWAHILLIFVFANYLPYSKHFHVFMSVPNVMLSSLDPLGKIENMESVTREVRLMLDPSAQTGHDSDEVPRFGVRDAEDVNWKNYLDSLACTECGRCTSVCPANITGKRLSPRKIMMDLRARMKERGPHLVREGKGFNDGRSLIRDIITEEELWACTTCNACAMECPININHPRLIVDMRRYLVMEEAAAPGELNAIFSNIENNGAPWQFSQHDRMNWARDLFIKERQ